MTVFGAVLTWILVRPDIYLVAGETANRHRFCWPQRPSRVEDLLPRQPDFLRNAVASSPSLGRTFPDHVTHPPDAPNPTRASLLYYSLSLSSLVRIASVPSVLLHATPIAQCVQPDMARATLIPLASRTRIRESHRRFRKELAVYRTFSTLSSRSYIPSLVLAHPSPC